MQSSSAPVRLCQQAAVIIKYPFWQMTAGANDATYACINGEDALCPQEISDKSILIQDDIDAVLRRLI